MFEYSKDLFRLIEGVVGEQSICCCLVGALVGGRAQGEEETEASSIPS